LCVGESFTHSAILADRAVKEEWLKDLTEVIRAVNESSKSRRVRMDQAMHSRRLSQKMHGNKERMHNFIKQQLVDLKSKTDGSDPSKSLSPSNRRSSIDGDPSQKS